MNKVKYIIKLANMFIACNNLEKHLNYEKKSFQQSYHFILISVYLTLITYIFFIYQKEIIQLFLCQPVDEILIKYVWKRLNIFQCHNILIINFSNILSFYRKENQFVAYLFKSAMWLKLKLLFWKLFMEA